MNFLPMAVSGPFSYLQLDELKPYAAQRVLQFC